MLSRKYGTQLAYTPMLNAGIFLRDVHYRNEHMDFCKEDRPLIVQVKTKYQFQLEEFQSPFRH